jgi:parallel beta-helix repeat protein
LTISKDTTWSGTVLVKGDVYVEPGVTLTITPGTIIKFKRIDETSDQNLFDIDSPYYPQAELIIRGRLIAKGTAKKKIIFTSAEVDARPADWGAVNFLGSNDNIIEHAKFSFAYNGVHAHGSSARIAHSEFVKNGVGISFKSEVEIPGVEWFGKRSNLTVTDNFFARNKGGIGFRSSDAVISHNEIIDNKFFGIFPKEDVKAEIRKNEITGNKKGVYLYQARGFKLNNNNIYDNKDYNISVAEAQDYNVDARSNWFGTINQKKIEEMIFDKKDDPDLGKVEYEPFLDKQVKWQLKK